MKKEISKEIHSRYSLKSGSEQCASLFSIYSLESLITDKHFKKILELGGGLGTLTELMLQITEAELITVENNNYCIKQIQKNLLNQRPYTLLTNYNKIVHFDFDLLVIDVNNGIFSVTDLVAASTDLRAIFIEGHHLAHRIKISREIFRKKQVQKLEDLRPGRGEKGCAIFSITVDNSIWNHRAYLSYLNVYPALLSSLLIIRIRNTIGKGFNKYERLRLVKSIRKLWFGKIPWNF